MKMTLMSTCQTLYLIRRKRKMKPSPSHHLLHPLPLNIQLPNLSFARNPTCPNSMLPLRRPRLHRQGTLRQKPPLLLEHSANPWTKASESRTFKRRIKIDIPGYQIFVIKKGIDQVMKTMIRELYTSLPVHGKRSRLLKSNIGNYLLDMNLKISGKSNRISGI